MPKITINKKKCIGCGLCTEICSKTFVMDGDKAKVKRPQVDKITCEKKAESSCPVGAIKID